LRKTIVGIFIACLLVIGVAGQTFAYSFTDTIDKWGLLQVDAIHVVQGIPLVYTHDLTQEVNFAAGDYVTSASLLLDFTNDIPDLEVGIAGPLFTENVKVAFDGHSWIQVGEVDNGVYSVGVNIATINDNGKVDITIAVYNNLTGSATAWLDESTLTGTACARAIPEPGTVMLFGAGLIGLAGWRLRKNS
jgi:hypothetical protein